MNKLCSFEEKVFFTVKKHGMLSCGDRVLVGLSGGKDSAVLLYVLNSLKDVLGISLCAFHLNHMIRGEEADRDEAFSRELCESLKIPFCSEKIDVVKHSKESGEGLEAAARSVRYGCFERVARGFDANKIATAHTLSDNTETLLMSLLRTGTLSEIPSVRDNIIRPLIDVTSEDVLEYAREKKIQYVTDSTNFSNDYLRNFFRNSIIPPIREKSPSFDSVIQKSGRIYSSYRRLAASLGERYFIQNTVPEDIKALKELASDTDMECVLFYVLTRIFENNGCTLTFDTFDSLSSEFKNSRSGKTFSVGNGKSVVIGYTRLLFLDTDKEALPYTVKLFRGRNPIPNSPYTVVIESIEEYEKKISDGRKINKLTKNIIIPCGILKNSFYARSRKDGDKYLCRGITRSIKKYFIDEKIDRHLRDTFPIVCDDEGIVWVAGLGVADRVKKHSSGELVSVSLEVELET